MATVIWANIGSGNGLLPDGTNPLPELMLTTQSVINELLWHQSPKSKFTVISHDISLYNKFEIYPTEAMS